MLKAFRLLRHTFDSSFVLTEESATANEAEHDFAINEKNGC
jgi:hypothetical protein